MNFLSKLNISIISLLSIYLLPNLGLAADQSGGPTSLDMIFSPVGIFCILIFIIAYGFVMAEELTPLDYVSAWDFVLIILAATVRLFIVLRYKALKMHLDGQKFKIKKYFDQKHIIRWAGHY